MRRRADSIEKFGTEMGGLQEAQRNQSCTEESQLEALFSGNEDLSPNYDTCLMTFWLSIPYILLILHQSMFNYVLGVV